MVKEALVRSYNRTYKLLLILPLAMLIFSIAYLGIFYQQNGDFIRKDVSLTGGTTVTVLDQNADLNAVKQSLSGQFPDVQVRGISDIGGGGQKGFTLETKADADSIKSALEEYLGYKLTNENSSIEFSGASLSEGFYRQLMGAIAASFLLMAWVVYITFADSRKMKGVATMLTFFGVALVLSDVSIVKLAGFAGIIIGMGVGIFVKGISKNQILTIAGIGVALLAVLGVYPSMWFVIPVVIALCVIYTMTSMPSFAVIFSAFADIIMTVAVVNLLGMTVSSAGIIAFLMLIGYSVDTDILLTSRLLKKKEGSVNERILGAFKTGITMTLTSLAAVGFSLLIIYSLSDTLRQIFTILLIGLFFDIFNTWVTNTSLLKWYVEARRII